jgi:enamine deaminase RidA (YjgF/YER057c/UK114 family)
MTQNFLKLRTAAGLSAQDIVATTIYLTDLKDFEVVNRAYASYFHSGPPARATVQVAALPSVDNRIPEFESVDNRQLRCQGCRSTALHGLVSSGTVYL